MPKSAFRILMVEDAEHMIVTVEFVLNGQYDLQFARSVAEARTAIEARTPDLILLDIGLPDESGIVLLRELSAENSSIAVIMLTASKDIGLAVEAMKLGAIDYIEKPFEKEGFLMAIHKAHDRWKLQKQVEHLRSELSQPFLFKGIIGESAAMRQVLAVARKMAVSDATVLITGESGTGKELVARAIHWEGSRRGGPFVAINCAQFTGTLLESELFGHEKGAFTGAVELHKGRFELAEGGTLFLDEIGNTSAEMQAKILRVVETKEFERVGGQKTIPADVRLIAATNANLEELVRDGRFREDLYYRLNVVRIEMPPLRERKEDIPVLCDHLLSQQRDKTGRPVRGFTPEAAALLAGYEWKGNVRELRNVIEMAVALEEGEWVTSRYFPVHILVCAALQLTDRKKERNILETVVEDFERRFITEQLRIHKWNHRRTARVLGVHRNTIENKLKKYGVHESESSQESA